MYKVPLPPAHSVPLTISQVWVFPRGSWAGLRPFNHFSCPLLSLLPTQTRTLARLGLVHVHSRTLLLPGGEASRGTSHPERGGWPAPAGGCCLALQLKLSH